MKTTTTAAKRRPVFWQAVFAIGLCVLGGLLSAGCAALNNNPTYRSLLGQTVLGTPTTGPQSGPDAIYLTDPLTTDPKNALNASVPLLPLQQGNYWDMATMVENKRGDETLVVTGPATNGFGQGGIGVETRRSGKRFRFEIYKNNPNGLFLLASQDETSVLMSYDPPVPLAKYPAKEGDTFLWRGQMRFGKETLPANALSRFSTQEKTKTLAGEIHAFRLDTMISVSRGGQDIRFPGVRWLAPHIGFVRRGYAQNNKPAFSEVSKFNVR